MGAFLLLAVIFWFVLAGFIAALAEAKGRNAVAFFFLSFLVPLGFIVALIVLLMPSAPRVVYIERPPAPQRTPPRFSYIPPEER